MVTALRPRTLGLFVGDILCLTLALWLSLWLRAFEVPSWGFYLAHLIPFLVLFIAWVGVFLIAGLYENRIILFGRRTLSSTLFAAQVFNVIIAALFFFFVPIFGIAPKTVLIIYLVVSFILIFCWRAFLFPLMGLQKKEPALVVGSGQEIDELVAALRAAPRSPVAITEVLAPAPGLAESVQEALVRTNPSMIIAHWQNPQVSGAFPSLVNFLGEGVRFIDAMNLYEEVFGRVPLSVLNDEWLANNVSRYAHTLYDPLKRAMDIVLGLMGGLVSLAAYPFVAIAIKLDDGGSIFVRLPRVGQDGRVINILKFRSMSGNDKGDYGADGKSRLTVTAVGRVLRNSRLDEIPQLWSVVRGDLSLIGPRPETPALVGVYEKEIPYYGARHLIKPGLSGWAQLYHDNHPHHGEEVGATREKLSYDLYYLKHRSLVLDAVVALKTVKKLLTRSGI